MWGLAVATLVMGHGTVWSDPAVETEVCGDCLDNDADSFVDYEDPDCCSQLGSLEVRRMTLMPETAFAPGTRLRLDAVYNETVRGSFDPPAKETSLQMSSEHGPIFCQTISTADWVTPRTRVELAKDLSPPRRRLFLFRHDPGPFAGALTDGRFVTQGEGPIRFRTRGRRLRMPDMGAGSVTVTFRVGHRCARSTARLRPRANGLVVP